MDYAKLHEEVVVILRSDRLRRIRDAHGSMTALGFTRHDDVWSLDRKGHVPPWQHASIIELDFLKNGIEIYASGSWDLIRCRYLFASLPMEYVPAFVEAVFTLANRLLLSVALDDAPTTREDLLEYLARCADDLHSEFGEIAGSESLAVLIQSTYPR